MAFQNIKDNNKPEEVQNVANPQVDINAEKPAQKPTPNTYEEEELEAPYTDKRSVTISLVKNYSAYRKMNMKVLGQRHEVIGSSVTSCRILSSNKGEVDAYFPQLIGLSPSNPEFITRVKAYLSNIQMNVNNENVTLNTSFVYNHKKDYLAIAKKEDAINAVYDKIDRANTAVIKEALKKKIEDLNNLEATKYLYGHPENLEDYLMYRHCLLYRDVAKDIALINEDTTIRFYIKDEQKEAARQKRLVEEKKHAMKHFVELCGTDEKFNAVFMQVAIYQNLILSEAIAKARDEKENILINYVNDNPDKFNKMYSDKNIIMRAFIETLILQGELVRSEYNQQISTADGTFIGSNMNEAIAYFNNYNNKGVYETYRNKLNLI
jgi:hypothetical protein